MPRDYPSRPDSRRSGNTARNKSRRPAAQRKPAARPTRARQANKSGPPAWLWLTCGLCIGLTAAAGFYIFARPAGNPGRQQIEIATPKAGTGHEPADNTRPPANARTQHGSAPAKPKQPKPRFSFYKMLPNYEVSVPRQDTGSAGGTGHGHKSHASHGQSSQPASQPATHPTREPGRYVIQAGSFSSRADADRRKAELALLGVSAEIADVDLDSGRRVYRVHSDPIASDDKLQRLVTRLRKNQIDTLVTRAH